MAPKKDSQEQSIENFLADWIDDSRYRSPDWRPYKVDVMENQGENWMIADFLTEEDGKNYILTTNRVHASEAYMFTRGAKADAEFICELLNRAYYEKIRK